jgi:hypothetical protein
MVAGSTIAVYNYQEESTKKYLYVISGLLILGALIISFVIKNKKYEDIWYKGRALAESCKTLTWRFMMNSELFERDLSEQDAKKRFTQRITEIKNNFADLNSELKAKHLSKVIFSTKMLEVRRMELQERKLFYLENRINDQINWYEKKADNNKSKYEFWFWLVIISQIMTIISISYLINQPSSNFNFVGVFSTLTVSFLSWMQVKKFQENKEAYTTAMLELNLIKQDAEYITTEGEFARFVLDSENAMSREHTLWLAQKRV